MKALGKRALRERDSDARCAGRKSEARGREHGAVCPALYQLLEWSLGEPERTQLVLEEPARTSPMQHDARLTPRRDVNDRGSPRDEIQVEITRCPFHAERHLEMSGTNAQGAMYTRVGKHIAPWLNVRELSLDLKLDPFEQDAINADSTVPPREVLPFSVGLFLAHVGLNTHVQVYSHLIAQMQ